MKKIKGNIVLYIFGMVALVVWVLFSNEWITKAKGVTIAEEVEFDSNWENDGVYFLCDQIKPKGDILEQVGIRGWAFAETEQSNENRYVSIVLKGTDHCYCVRCEQPEEKGTYDEIIVREDVQEQYPDYHIPSANVGFTCDFSTLNVQDGEYELYLYCWENLDNYGVANTGWRLQKNGADITILSGGASEAKTVEPQEVTQSEICESVIAPVGVQDGLISITGWTFVKNMPSEAQNVYLEILKDSEDVSTVYETYEKTWAGVGRAFQDDRYNDSGFDVSISEQNVPDGTYTLRLLVENGGEVWASNYYEMIRVGTEVKINPYPVGPEQVELTVEPEAEKCLSHIDSATITEDSISIWGWAFKEDMLSDTQSVYLELTDPEGMKTVFATTAGIRDDVGEAYSDTRYSQSGFGITIPEKQLSNDRYTIRLLVENQGKVWASVEYELIKNGEDLICQEKAG